MTSLFSSGFEAGGQNTPSDISPWAIIGNETTVSVGTDLTSPFKRNPVALRVQSNCDAGACPSSGVGIYNPGFWGMVYKLIDIFYTNISQLGEGGFVSLLILVLLLI